MSMAPSFVRAAQATPTNEPVLATDALAFARSSIPSSTAAPLRAPAPTAVTTAASTMTLPTHCQLIGLSGTFSSESESNAELERSRLADCGDGIEAGDRVRGKRPGTECVVAGEVVHAIGQIERFDQAFHLHVATDANGATDAEIQ